MGIMYFLDTESNGGRRVPAETDGGSSLNKPFRHFRISGDGVRKQEQRISILDVSPGH